MSAGKSPHTGKGNKPDPEPLMWLRLLVAALAAVSQLATAAT